MFKNNKMTPGNMVLSRFCVNLQNIYHSDTNKDILTSASIISFNKYNPDTNTSGTLKDRTHNLINIVLLKYDTSNASHKIIHIKLNLISNVDIYL